MLPERKNARMAELNAIVGYADQLLDTARFQDYCPNGLQVEGRSQVQRIASGVTASQAFIDAALERGADLLLVHHGYFWRGEDPRVVGVKARRLGTLLRAGVSLVAYHLPLDAHADLGNNARLAAELELRVDGRFGAGEVAMYGQPLHPLSAEELAQRIASRLGRAPLHIAPDIDRPIARIGWCSGAAQDYLDQAADLGLDAYISGEISERTVHAARERGIHYFAAGHHATERHGVQALGENLARRFGLEHFYIDVPNPV
jgi:dinuclear metal center YbgI/SA1388 family protein